MPSPVLVADDSPVARLSITREVRAKGLAVVERESAAGASTVDPTTIACALLDLELGDGVGTDVAARLRSSRADLPVAFFSSASSGDLLDRARALGPVFAKPAELADAIAWVIANASA